MSAQSPSTENSPASHIITQADTKQSLGETLLGHKEGHTLFPFVQMCVSLVLANMPFLVFANSYSYSIRHVFNKRIQTSSDALFS